MTEPTCYLLDVNVLVALAFRDHQHHPLVKPWFNASAERQWALCAFTEAGFLRISTAPGSTQISIPQATWVLAELTRHPGYRYQTITADWRTLSSPFFNRLHGTKQVTDAYLLGLAIREGLTLVTLDKAILHLAGEQKSHVLLLTEKTT